MRRRIAIVMLMAACAAPAPGRRDSSNATGMAAVDSVALLDSATTDTVPRVVKKGASTARPAARTAPVATRTQTKDAARSDGSVIGRDRAFEIDLRDSSRHLPTLNDSIPRPPRPPRD